MANRIINILGVMYTVEEVDTVNKTEPRKGEIDYLTNEIKIDKYMPQTLKEQVLMHEILHATFDLLGMSELAEDEEKVQCIATALHQIFTAQAIFFQRKGGERDVHAENDNDQPGSGGNRVKL